MVCFLIVLTLMSSRNKLCRNMLIRLEKFCLSTTILTETLRSCLDGGLNLNPDRVSSSSTKRVLSVEW